MKKKPNKMNNKMEKRQKMSNYQIIIIMKPKLMIIKIKMHKNKNQMKMFNKMK